MMHSGQHKDKISDIKTDDSYWGFGRYCVQGDLIVWSQSREQFVGQSQICGLVTLNFDVTSLIARALLFTASAD